MCAADVQSQKSSESSSPPHPHDPRRALGRLGEEQAAAHLERCGFTILARNVRTRHGEIDLIACDDATLVFVEVKTARLHHSGPATRSRREPLCWLGAPQRARLRRLAAAWLCQGGVQRPRTTRIRFDAIGVTLDRHDALVHLDHLEDAW